MKQNKLGLPAHIERASSAAGKASRRKRQASPVKTYRPGYFTEPVLGGQDGNTWPPGWEPHRDPLKTATEYRLDAARTIAMQRRVGFASGGGTVAMPGTPPKRGRPRNHEGGR